MFSWRISESAELRLLEERHAARLFQLVERNRASLREWLPWVDQTSTADDVQTFIRSALAQHARNEGFHAGIWDHGELAGAIGVHTIQWEHRQTSIGYWMSEPHRGKGLVTKACLAVLGYLFDDLELRRVEIRCGVGNVKSCAIPERLGFKREGVLRDVQFVAGRYIDLNIYGMLRHEWRARAGL